jgi:cilia- and flagella-associated protein 52
MCVHQVELQGAVVSMTLSPNGGEVLAGCASGNIYRCLIHQLTADLITTSHTSAVTAISCGSFEGERSGLFATGTSNGELRVWDIADYACVAFRREAKSGAVMCLGFMDNNSLVISGWGDGSVRCHDMSLNRVMWTIPQAHRDGVRSIAICDEPDRRLRFMVTGGNDGTVRVWRLGNRELMTQYSEHSKSVVKVLVDNVEQNIVHSVSLDCTVLSYDLKTDKRKISHIIRGGALTYMTQRTDSERELITCDTQGRLLHWDIDVRDPVLVVQDAGANPSLSVCAISPSGRFLAFAGVDMVLKILEVATNQIVSLGNGHSDGIVAMAWTPDERQIITGSGDTCMCVWNFFLGGV